MQISHPRIFAPILSSRKPPPPRRIEFTVPASRARSAPASKALFRQTSSGRTATRHVKCYYKSRGWDLGLGYEKARVRAAVWRTCSREALLVTV